MKKTYNLIIIGAALLGLILSAILMRHHVDHSYKSPLCGVEESNGCNVLNRSSASEIFGIPVAFLGFIYYGLTFFMAYFSSRERSMLPLIFLISLVALITDLSLFLYSIFVAETLCRLCALTYLATLAIVIPAYLDIAKNKSGFIPDFSGWIKERYSFVLVALLSGTIVFLAGGFLYKSYGSGATSPVSSRGSYTDHMIIAENEFIKEYQNQPVVNFRADPPSKKGPLKGIINIVEFADYLCPHCRIMTTELDKFLQKHPDEVSVTYRHYPLDQACNPAITRPFHQGACLLSYASYCALKQGKFWDMNKTIFDHQEELAKAPVSVAQVQSFATRIGLNQAAFGACLNENETKQMIQMDVQEANEQGISGTPTIYINGRKMDFYEHLVERLLIFEKQKTRDVNKR